MFSGPFRPQLHANLPGKVRVVRIALESRSLPDDETGNYQDGIREIEFPDTRPRADWIPCKCLEGAKLGGIDVVQ